MQEIVNCILVYIDGRCQGFFNDQFTNKVRKKGKNTSMVLANGPSMIKLKIVKKIQLIIQFERIIRSEERRVGKEC